MSAPENISAEPVTRGSVGPRRGRRVPTRFVMVTGTFLLAVLLYVDRICISTAKTSISTELALSDEQFGWILSAFALGYAIFQTPSGMLVDRYGPRRVLTAIIALWSLFTGLTGMLYSFASLLVVRFFFGAGEAGGYPSMTRAVYAWIPLRERGIVTGINFSGARLGAAGTLPLVAWAVQTFGWRHTFLWLMGIGFGWAAIWYAWFRDDPARHPAMSESELKFIREGMPETAAAPAAGLRPSRLFGSANVWLAMAQYFSSCFTFFFCLTWLFPHLQKTYSLDAVSAGWYAAAPLVAGAIGNVFGGWLVDRILAHGQPRRSRQIPAILGFILAAIGLVTCAFMTTPLASVAWLSLAIFGADMTLPPSWAFCIDIGRAHSGTVSGTMNMAGFVGSFATSIAFPYLLKWTGNPDTFFYLGAALNALAAVAWCYVRPERRLD